MRGSWIFIILILFACKKKQDFSTVKVFGHAAMGLNIENSLFHDNSREAIEFALGIEGCDGVEIDVQLSKDGELWLYHDNDLSSQTNGSSCIAEQNSTYLNDLHYKTFDQEKLTKLTDFNSDLFKNRTVFLDIRHLNECTGQFVNKTDFLSAIMGSDLLNNAEIKVYYILANPEWIHDFSLAGLSVLFSASGTTNFEGLLGQYPELKGLVVKNSEVRHEDVEQIHALDKKVFIFEMRSPKGIRSAFHKFPDGLITDDIRTTLIEKY